MEIGPSVLLKDRSRLGMTKTVKLAGVWRLPSETVRVTVTVPTCPGAAVMVTVLLFGPPPAPFVTIFATGMTFRSDELTVTERLSAAVSGSDMVNGIGPLLPPDEITTKPVEIEMLGASLTAVNAMLIG